MEEVVFYSMPIANTKCETNLFEVNPNPIKTVLNPNDDWISRLMNFRFC